MDIKLIKDYLSFTKTFSIPIIQKKYNLTYYEVKQIMDKLENEGLVKFKSGVEYVWVKEEKKDKEDKDDELPDIFSIDEESCSKEFLDSKKRMEKNLDAIFEGIEVAKDEKRLKLITTEKEFDELYEKSKLHQDFLKGQKEKGDSFSVMDCDFDDSLLFPMIWEDLGRIGNVKNERLLDYLREDVFSESCERFIILTLYYNKDFDKNALIEYIKDYPNKFNLSENNKKLADKALSGVMATSDEDFEKVKSLIHKE